MNVYLTQEQLEAWEAYKLNVDATDWHRWKMEHVAIFQHIPEPNFEKREMCDHPIHVQLARAMNGGDMQMRHELIKRSTIVTEDDEEIDPRFGTKEYEDRLSEGWDGAITGRED